MRLGNFELLYEESQQPQLGVNFIGFDASLVNRPIFREIYGFLEFAKKKAWSQFDLAGLFSPRFYEKMALDYQSYSEFLNTNPGYDVYLFHPFPAELSIANHFLELAELEHPGISAAINLVWEKLFLSQPPELNLPADEIYCCHCNYFLASPDFWNDYSEFIFGFCDILDSDCGNFLKLETPYTLSSGFDRVLPLAVFVFERSLSLFIKMRSSKYKVASFHLTSEQWRPNELFEGEKKFIDSLLNEINRFNEHDIVHFSKSLAINSYFNYRKLRWLV